LKKNGRETIGKKEIENEREERKHPFDPGYSPEGGQPAEGSTKPKSIRKLKNEKKNE
jgi:hypothetical protein